jgi:23S rRNA (uracil1939-C5)-methyltransferase
MTPTETTAKGHRVTKLYIESLAYGGDAIAHLEDGRAAFVVGGCPGDTVDAEITSDQGRFVRAKVREVIEPSPDRVKPPCPYFGLCGGCNWQHVSYERQLTSKRQAVVDALTRIGRVSDAETIVAETVASPEQYGYRNKVELVVDRTTGRPRLGFHEAGSDGFVPVDSCLLLPKAHIKDPKSLAGALRYISGEQDLGITRVGIRIASHTRDVEIALWTEPGAFPRRMAATTLGTAVRASSIVRVLVKGVAKARKVTGVEVLAGSGYWKERLLGTTMAISAPSFFQVNTKAAEKLLSLVLDGLAVDGTDRVLDLYSGAGTFTLPLAVVAGETIAVEAASSAVRDLRRNLENAELWADVIGGDAGRELATIGHLDAVVVDPPRAGLQPEAVASLAATNATRIAYISCDPTTLARDTKSLTENGYRLVSATPVDLFPQTYHIETVAIFERVSD